MERDVSLVIIGLIVPMALGPAAVAGFEREGGGGSQATHASEPPAPAADAGTSQARSPEYEAAKGVFLRALAEKRADAAKVEALRDVARQQAGRIGAVGLEQRGWPMPDPDIEARYRGAEASFRAAGATDADIRLLGKALERKTESRHAPEGASLGVGDAAPALDVERFIKGEPVKAFERGRIYVIDCWASWVPPWTRNTAPRLTALQAKHKDKLTVIGVNVSEAETYKPETLDKVRQFLAKHDAKVGYAIAYDGGARKTHAAYMQASKRDVIPSVFVIDGDGRIAYIGHAIDTKFDTTVEQLIAGTFDMAGAKAEADRRNK
jgi:thiol-disulfide isomerase/thioredoxin